MFTCFFESYLGRMFCSLTIIDLYSDTFFVLYDENDEERTFGDEIE